VKRRDFITLLGGAAAAWPLAARAQQPADKVYRIGVLETISAALNGAKFDAMRDGMRTLGYVEGRNLVFEYRSADGQAGRFPELAAELVRLNVDLIVTRGTPAALAAKNATKVIPIVMASIGNPLLVAASLARPGGNLTGLSAVVVDLYAKRVELLREAVVRAKRISALLNMGNTAHPPEWIEIRRAAGAMGVEAELFDIRRVEDLEPAVEAASRQDANAIVVGLDAVTQKNLAMIVKLAAQYRLPAIYASREFVDGGGLLGYGPSYPDLYRRAASYVDKILKGAKPADLPIEQPTKFELVINLKAAKALGLEVPPTLLARADEVIE
jgi:putative ABC transport system substrate-binding protein